MKKKILVTGGTGYIGSHTTVALLNAGYDAVIADNLSNSRIDALDGIEKITGTRPSFYQTDAVNQNDLNKIFNDHPDISGAIHFAAHKVVNESIWKPVKYYRNNIVSLLNLIESMQAFDTKNLVFSSSAAVYGQPDSLPVTEDAPLKSPSSPYGNTKQICEDIIQDLCTADGSFSAVLLRYFNPVGAHDSALIGEYPAGVPDNLMPFITQIAAGIRGSLKIFGGDYDTPDGTCIRDYIHVVDLAAAHVCAIDRMLGHRMSESCEIYNIGTGKGISVLEIVSSFERITGIKLNYSITERREGDSAEVWADTKKAENILGWHAERDLDDMISSAWNGRKESGEYKTHLRK